MTSIEEFVKNYTVVWNLPTIGYILPKAGMDIPSYISEIKKQTSQLVGKYFVTEVCIAPDLESLDSARTKEGVTVCVYESPHLNIMELADLTRRVSKTNGREYLSPKFRRIGPKMTKSLQLQAQHQNTFHANSVFQHEDYILFLTHLPRLERTVDQLRHSYQQNSMGQLPITNIYL